MLFERFPISHRPWKTPSFVMRTGGFLFLTASLTCSAGSPWFDHLGLDPGWLLEEGIDSARTSTPQAGISVRSNSELALRTPLRLFWNSTEIDQTFAGTVSSGSWQWTTWFEVPVQNQDRNFSTSSFALETGSNQIGLRAGTEWKGDRVRLKMGVDQETGRDALSGSIQVTQGTALLEAGVQRSNHRAQMVVTTAKGSLSMDWKDVSDSLGALLTLPIGSSRWIASAWTRKDASPVQDLTDTGSASGWAIGCSIPTEFGKGIAGYSWDRADLRTLGSREGRLFHDQDWQTVRVGLNLGWTAGPWRLSGSTRQIRWEFPFQGIDRPFLQWNMIPEDVFTRVEGILENQSEYLSGSVRVEHWTGALDRTWAWKSLSFTPSLGASWTGFDLLVKHSTLDVRGLIPYVTESVPCDGTGWIAMTMARANLAWQPSSRTVFHLGGIWRQPLAGAWHSRQVASSARGTSSLAESGNAIDPLGFHEWSLDGRIAF